MKFVRVYEGTRTLLINLDHVQRIEPRGAGSTLYIGATSVITTAPLTEIEKQLGSVATVGVPATPPKPPKEFDDDVMVDFGLEGPQAETAQPRDER